MSNKSKYDEAESYTCPYCEKQFVTAEADKKYEDLLDSIAENDNREKQIELDELEEQFCWYGWEQPGNCRDGMSIENRLIEVLGQRDEYREKYDFLCQNPTAW